MDEEDLEEMFKGIEDDDEADLFNGVEPLEEALSSMSVSSPPASSAAWSSGNKVVVLDSSTEDEDAPTRARSSELPARLFSSSPTPQVQRVQQQVCTISSDSGDNGVDDPGAVSEWGDDAVLVWEGADAVVDDGVPHVPASATETEAEDYNEDDAWGADACLVYDSEAEVGVSEHHGRWLGGYVSQGSDGDDDDEATDEEEGGMGGYDEALEHSDAVDDDESASEPEQVPAPARASRSIPTSDTTTIPVYTSWDTGRLQRLVAGFGYRPSTNRGALVAIARECWVALHPVGESGDGESGPAATTTAAAGSKGKRKAKAKAAPKGRSARRKAADADEADELDDDGTTAAGYGATADLDKVFYDMIHGDTALWLRVLRYEPLAFDDLVARATALPVTKRGWKSYLKVFLDKRGVTYYTSDSTAPRKRY